MAFKMNARSPLMKTLVGAQKNLPQGLKSAIEAAPGKMMDSPAKANSDLISGAAVKGVKKPTKDIEIAKSAKAEDAEASPAKMNRGERYDMKMASDQNLKASARKNYAENAEAAQKSSPAKSIFTDQVQGRVSKPRKQSQYSQAGIAANNKGKSAGSAPAARPAKQKAVELKSKKASLGSTAAASYTPPAAVKPTASTGKTKVKKKVNTPNVRTIGGGAANGGSTTLTVKTGGGANKGGSTKRERVTKNSKKVVTKTAGTRTVEKTNKDGSSSTKTTKRIGKGRIKGAIKNARLARLDRVATRQAAKAKGSGKKPGSKTQQFG